MVPDLDLKAACKAKASRLTEGDKPSSMRRDWPPASPLAGSAAAPILRRSSGICPANSASRSRCRRYIQMNRSSPWMNRQADRSRNVHSQDVVPASGYLRDGQAASIGAKSSRHKRDKGQKRARLGQNELTSPGREIPRTPRCYKPASAA